MIVIIEEHASTARSHNRSGSRSPALAKPMMALAIASRGGSTTPQLWRPGWQFEWHPQEMRGLWIEPFPVEISSDRHVEYGRQRAIRLEFGSEGKQLSVRYPTKQPQVLVFFGAATRGAYR